ncbi:hypothetical protein ACWDUL_03300 [Nocardia niigatensis]|uniref:hypothetical protein n=1 Tax=Nocardia niigatensis TaxID=209249 RepID=UPI0012F66534|nr:hypothetical protein [Nocardia niigatensis]
MFATAEGWLPSEGDMHLRVWLAGVVFDYTAAVAAVHNLIQDWQARRWCAFELMGGTADDRRPLPRLPCEQLFLGP